MAGLKAWFGAQFRKARRAEAQCDTFGSSVALWALQRSRGLVLGSLLLCAAVLALPSARLLLLQHLPVSGEGIVPQHILELQQHQAAGGVGHHPGEGREETLKHRNHGQAGPA